MNVIEVSVRNKIAFCLETAMIVCGNNDYMINFNFDAEWDDYPIKTARFIYNGSYADVVFEGASVNVPVIHKSTVMAVGVFAGNLRTTTPCLIPCQKSIICDEGFVADPPPEVYQQLVDLCNEAVETAKDVEERANNGEFDGDNAESYIVTLGFEYEMNEDGGYTITDELKHNDVRVGANDIFNAYKSGNTVILIANGNDIFQLTSARPVDDTALVEFARTNNSEHWTIEVYGSYASVKEHIGRIEDTHNKVLETDVTGVEQYEEYFHKYPSMPTMIYYVKDKVNSIKPYIVTLGFDYEINPETGGYYITDPPKHNRRQVTSNDIYEAYQAGRTVVLIANDAIVCPLTDRIVIDTDYYGVRFTGFCDSDSKLNIEILDTSCRVTDAKVEDERNKVWAWELDEDEGGNLEDAFKDGRYPSMGAMVKYVEEKTGDIETALDNIIEIQNSLMGVSE